MRTVQFGRSFIILFLVCGVVLAWTAWAVAARPIDVSKLKRGDKLEYNSIGDRWETVEYLGRGITNSTIRIRGGGFPRERNVPIDWVRLPAATKAKKNKAEPSSTAAHPDNPFATSDEKVTVMKPRTWSDASGKFKIEGTLLGVEGESVVLRRTDQQEITVPLERLSEADKKFVADYQAGKSLNPVASGSKNLGTPTSNVDEDESNPQEQKLLPLTPTDLNSANLIEIVGQPDWKYEPDSATDPTPLRQVRVGLKPVDFFARAKRLLLLPQEKKAFVVFKNGRPGQDATSVVQACDLQRGKLEGAAVFGVDEMPIAISPDGKLVVSCTDKFGFGGKGELRLYQREGQKVKPLAAWQPYGHHRSPFSKNTGGRPQFGTRFGDEKARSRFGGRLGPRFADDEEDENEEETDDPTARPDLWADADVEWAEFVDHHHLLTMGHGGEMALWKLPEIEPLYVIKARRSQPALSPGRNYVAVAVREGLAILRVNDGEVAGLIPLAADNTSGSIAFRQDGKRLALLQAGQWSRVRVWDLESQELLRDFAVKDAAPGWTTHAMWTTDDHLLCGSTVVDVSRRIPIWRYAGLNDAWQFYDGRAWYVAQGLGGSENKVLASATVPPQQAIDAVAKLNPEDLLVIHPGMEVEVDLQGGSSDDLNTAREAILRRLEENDMLVAPQSNVRLVGGIEPGETKTVKYSTRMGSFGRPFDRQVSEHSVTEQVLTLSFEIDGNAVWKYQQRTTPPSSLWLEKDQTLDQALAERMQQDAKTFGQIWVPSYVAQVPGGDNQQAAAAP